MSNCVSREYDGGTGLDSDFKVLSGRVAFVYFDTTGVLDFDRYVEEQREEAIKAILFIGEHKVLPRVMARLCGKANSK